MIGAGEALTVAAALGQFDAAMTAGIKESLRLAVFVAGDENRLAGNIGGVEVARVGNVGGKRDQLRTL